MTTDDTEKRLISYIEASTQAASALGKIHGLTVSSSDILVALTEVLNIPEQPPHGVLDHDLTSPQIVELLKEFDFRKNQHTLLCEIELDEPLIPDSVPKILTEQTVKVKGEQWRVHKCDVDPFPSNPHAHNYAAGVVLHLGNGEMYQNRKSIGNIGCKKLIALRNKLSGLSLPATACV